MVIDGVPQDFLELCKSYPEVPQIFSPLSPSSALPLLSVSGPVQSMAIDRTRLIKNYADAYTDTHGLHSGQGFIFKTGPAWPRRKGLDTRPFWRELRAVNGHAIAPIWDDILTRFEEYFKGAGLAFTAVMPLSFANVGEDKAFCGLVVAIGVEPSKVTFEDAKTVALYAKRNILAEAGFDDVEVAVWEFETFFSGPKLPSLDPLLHRELTEFHHPFTSTLGIPVAPLRKPSYEGSLGVFLTCGDTNLMALTAAHVARPPPMFTDNKGLSLKAADRYHEEVIALGFRAFDLAIGKIQNKVKLLQECIARVGLDLEALQGRLNNGVVDVNGIMADNIQQIKRDVASWMRSIRHLGLLYTRVTRLIPAAKNRVIGRVLFADPISVSSDGPNGFTLDWAVLGIQKDAFDDDFEGNMLYIGTSPKLLPCRLLRLYHAGDKLDEATFLKEMFPNVADREGYQYPTDGKLPIRGVVPLDEILHPKHFDANGDPAMAVVKNGISTGTTVGWMSGLKSLVRYYKHIDVEFTSRELTVVPYDNKGRGPFSGEGDSGSAIVERGGRVVALLTAGGGITDATDVTFATPYCELERRMKEVFPSIRLY